MAQQLKFVSCLKMMMEELATLATGCEVDGGQLRFQLYVWLEREVEALKEVCNYCCTLSDGADFKLWEDSFWGEYFSNIENTQNVSGCWCWIPWHLDITCTNLHFVFTVY
ncbi:uncharacterized protein [Penaeus vannamei]